MLLLDVRNHEEIGHIHNFLKKLLLIEKIGTYSVFGKRKKRVNSYRIVIVCAASRYKEMDTSGTGCWSAAALPSATFLLCHRLLIKDI